MPNSPEGPGGVPPKPATPAQPESNTNPLTPAGSRVGRMLGGFATNLNITDRLKGEARKRVARLAAAAVISSVNVNGPRVIKRGPDSPSVPSDKLDSDPMPLYKAEFMRIARDYTERISIATSKLEVATMRAAQVDARAIDIILLESSVSQAQSLAKRQKSNFNTIFNVSLAKKDEVKNDKDIKIIEGRFRAALDELNINILEAEDVLKNKKKAEAEKAGPSAVTGEINLDELDRSFRYNTSDAEGFLRNYNTYSGLLNITDKETLSRHINTGESIKVDLKELEGRLSDERKEKVTSLIAKVNEKLTALRAELASRKAPEEIKSGPKSQNLPILNDELPSEYLFTSRTGMTSSPAAPSEPDPSAEPVDVSKLADAATTDRTPDQVALDASPEDIMAAEWAAALANGFDESKGDDAGADSNTAGATDSAPVEAAAPVAAGAAAAAPVPPAHPPVLSPAPGPLPVTGGGSGAGSPPPAAPPQSPAPAASPDDDGDLWSYRFTSRSINTFIENINGDKIDIELSNDAGDDVDISVTISDFNAIQDYLASLRRKLGQIDSIVKDRLTDRNVFDQERTKLKELIGKEISKFNSPKDRLRVADQPVSEPKESAQEERARTAFVKRYNLQSAKEESVDSLMPIVLRTEELLDVLDVIRSDDREWFKIRDMVKHFGGVLPSAETLDPADTNNVYYKYLLTQYPAGKSTTLVQLERYCTELNNVNVDLEKVKGKNKSINILFDRTEVALAKSRNIFSHVKNIIDITGMDGSTTPENAARMRTRRANPVENVLSDLFGHLKSGETLEGRKEKILKWKEDVFDTRQVEQFGERNMTPGMKSLLEGQLPELERVKSLIELYFELVSWEDELSDEDKNKFKELLLMYVGVGTHKNDDKEIEGMWKAQITTFSTDSYAVKDSKHKAEEAKLKLKIQQARDAHYRKPHVTRPAPAPVAAPATGAAAPAPAAAPAVAGTPGTTATPESKTIDQISGKWLEIRKAVDAAKREFEDSDKSEASKEKLKKALGDKLDDVTACMADLLIFEVKNPAKGFSEKKLDRNNPKFKTAAGKIDQDKYDKYVEAWQQRKNKHEENKKGSSNKVLLDRLETLNTEIRAAIGIKDMDLDKGIKSHEDELDDLRAKVFDFVTKYNQDVKIFQEDKKQLGLIRDYAQYDLIKLKNKLSKFNPGKEGLAAEPDNFNSPDPALQPMAFIRKQLVAQLEKIEKETGPKIQHPDVKALDTLLYEDIKGSWMVQRDLDENGNEVPKDIEQYRKKSKTLFGDTPVMHLIDSIYDGKENSLSELSRARTLGLTLGRSTIEISDSKAQGLEEKIVALQKLLTKLRDPNYVKLMAKIKLAEGYRDVAEIVQKKKEDGSDETYDEARIRMIKEAQDDLEKQGLVSEVRRKLIKYLGNEDGLQAYVEGLREVVKGNRIANDKFKEIKERMSANGQLVTPRSDVRKLEEKNLPGADTMATVIASLTVSLAASYYEGNGGSLEEKSKGIYKVNKENVRGILSNSELTYYDEGDTFWEEPKKGRVESFGTVEGLKAKKEGKSPKIFWYRSGPPGAQVIREFYLTEAEYKKHFDEKGMLRPNRKVGKAEKTFFDAMLKMRKKGVDISADLEVAGVTLGQKIRDFFLSNKKSARDDRTEPQLDKTEPEEELAPTT